MVILALGALLLTLGAIAITRSVRQAGRRSAE
jgi:hypothetical protein